MIENMIENMIRNSIISDEEKVIEGTESDNEVELSDDMNSATVGNFIL